jgi:hypothetical protein
MKTQINTLLSGTKNQILNENKDYSLFNKATSHNGHAGTSNVIVNQINEVLKTENKDAMKISFFGHEIELKATHSLSGKSCNWYGSLPVELASKLLILPKNPKPYILIHSANLIEVRNGKNLYKYVCPSLIEIL